MIALEHYVVLGSILFAIGAVGFLVRRNVLVALMSIELMLNAVNLTLVAFSRRHLDHNGQMFAFFVIAVAAAEAAVGLAIVISLYRVKNTVRTDQVDQLKGLPMEKLFELFPAENFSLFSVILGLPLLGAFVNGVFGRRLGRDGVRLMALASIGGSFIAAVVAFAMLHEHAHQLHGAGGEIAENPRLVWVIYKWMSLSLANGVGSTSVPVSFAIDPLSGTMMLIVTGVGWLIHLYSTAYMWDDDSFHRFFAYLNLFIFSMLVLILGDSMPLLFVGWEGVGLCSYLLIGFWFTEEKNAAAGKKAFIANRIGDFGLLVGMAMLLYYTGALDFAGINSGAKGLLTEVQIWPLGNGLPRFLSFLQPAVPVKVYASTLCGLMLFLGCAGKSAQIPLYVWLPDAMAGPTPVSALIHAATMVTAGVYLVCRLSVIFVLSPFTMATIATIGALTAIFAASIGLVQNDIKKVLAYSTVSQLGYMFLGVGVGAFAAGFFHVFTHAFFKACLFLGAGSVIHAMHARIHDTDGSQDMRNMGGLRKFMPYTHATYLVSCLAISGIPVFSGFFSKDEILGKAYDSLVIGPTDVPNLWHAPESLGKILYVVGLIAAVMTAFYMFRTYFLTFWGEFKGWAIVSGFKEPKHDHGHAADEAHPSDIQTGDDPHGHAEHHAFEPGTGRDHLEGGDPHESPWQMWVPLVVLATFAALAGFLNAGILAEQLHAPSLAWMHHWLEPVFKAASTSVKVPEFESGHAWMLASGGIAVGLIGAGFAYWNYVLNDGAMTRQWAESAQGFYELLLDKWRVDELYDATVVGAVDELANSAVVFDKWVVDGILAKLSALLVQGLGYVLRLFQTGRVQTYAASMVVGMAALAWFLYMPHADVAIQGDEATGAYKVVAAGGPGYQYKWHVEGDAKQDSKDFEDRGEIDFNLEPGKTELVALEVKNAFGRRAKKVVPVTRPRRDGQAATMEELQKQLEEMQKLLNQQ